MAEQALADEVERLAVEIPDTLAGLGLWSPRFPSPDMVEAAASLIPDQPCGQVQEGPSWRVTISPGKVKVWTVDEARAERTANRQLDAQRRHTDALAAFLGEDGEIPEATPSREITEWSRKSRRNMTERALDLDYSPLFADPSRLPSMLTLTYPGCWLRVAPNGKAVKKHMKKLRKRYLRAFGETLCCVWKLEFQGRVPGKWCTCDWCGDFDDGRAPHVHMLMTPPLVAADDGRYFRQWVSETWAEIVDHPDPEQYQRHVRAGTAVDYAQGMRSSDPRRVAVYFTKHGGATAKEYQHYVPRAWQEPGEGPGRFWGYWGLQPVYGIRSVSPETGTQAGRTVRRWSKAQRVTHQVRKPRTKRGLPVSKYPDVIGLAGAQLLASRTVKHRPTRVRAVRAKNGRGWISVNDGPAFGTELAMWLHVRHDQAHRDQHRVELQRCGLWDSPLARARRLRASERRDALIARLENRA